MVAGAAVARAATPDRDWPVYLGDAGGTHYSSIAQINRANVATLRPIWTYHSEKGARGGLNECNPLVVGGRLFGTSPFLKLFALDAATGRELWQFDPFADDPGDAFRGVNRGLTFWGKGDEERVMFSAGRYLYAIDARTGAPLRAFGDNGRIDLRRELDRDADDLNVYGTSPGAIYRDLIIVPTTVGEGPGPAAPGHIRAYDVRTGQRRWIFHTIPHPGEMGYDTWPKDAWSSSGGANCWTGLTIDHERGTAFVPTGSATFDFWGGDRAGSNLFANCLLALDAATGKLKWHFQFVHHDLWDHDLPAPPVLCTVTRDGKKIAAVAQTTKSGHVWLFDRDTGESLFPWEEKAMPASTIPGEATAITQPQLLKPAPFARQVFTEEEVTNRTPEAHAAVLKRLREVSPHRLFDPPSTRGAIIYPGMNGGAEWGGAAVDPDGILYVNSTEMAWILTLVPTQDGGTSAGASLYRQLCMSCHGLDRRGNAAQSTPPLVNLRARYQVAELMTLLQTGRGPMPSFGHLEAAQRKSLARHLLDLESSASDPVVSGPPAPRPPVAATSPYVTTGYNRFLDPDGYPAMRPPWGTLNAIDLNSGEYLWRRELGEFKELTAQGVPPTGTENYGGPLVTSGGLLFIAATKDRKIRAFDTRTGEQLWSADLPASGFATPATYALAGRQYIVIASGGGKGTSGTSDAYIAFALPNPTPTPVE
ncbi:MAG: Quinoprotein glucose dehydrogenase [Verrucomicrobiota bacterium]|jgi:quinoprotein glucose dehydrogenase